jgi:outer membrane protein TolC
VQLAESNYNPPSRAAVPEDAAPDDKRDVLPAEAAVAPDAYPLDLATALRLAGANNLQIALAGERVRQAQARLQGAEALWLPSLQFGAGYNNHEGRIQDTGGRIVEVRRSGVFAGGGPNSGPAALTGGDGSSRLALGVPLVDLFFAPLARRQEVEAANAARATTFNDTLLQAGLGYLTLVQTAEQVAIAGEAVEHATELVRLIDSQVRAGKAIAADLLRAKAELADRQRQQLQAQETVRVASTDLARLLRLDATLSLVPAETQPAPVDLVDADAPLPALLAQGIAGRPELAENRAVVETALARLRQEKCRPWVPDLQVGYSAGVYGGGAGSFVGDFGGRGDFDAILVWELRSLGFGNRALQRERASQVRQARLSGEDVRDAIAAEIVRAYYRVRLRRRQIEAARAQVQAAAEALPLNFKGVLDGALRAIEALQAVQTLALARTHYLAAVLDYNRAQLELLRALGHPLLDGPLPECTGPTAADQPRAEADKALTPQGTAGIHPAAR